MDSSTEATTDSAASLRALVGVTLIGAVGAALMAIAHSGVEVPVVSALGPGGDRAVPQAAGGFAVGAVLYAIVAAAIVRRRAWGWAFGVLVHTLALIAAAFPFRGAGSIAGIAVSVIGVALLLSPSVRGALLPR